MVTGIIYKFTFPNGKVYIGQTITLNARKRQHLSKKLGDAVYKAYEKYGTYEYDVIEVVENESKFLVQEELNLLESHYISLYHATDPAYGYNKRQGNWMSTIGSKFKLFNRIHNYIFKQKAQAKADFLNNIMIKVSNTFEPLTEEESLFVKDYVIKKDRKLEKFNLVELEKNSDKQIQDFYEKVLHVNQEYCIRISDEIMTWIRENEDEAINKYINLV